MCFAHEVYVVLHPAEKSVSFKPHSAHVYRVCNQLRVGLVGGDINPQKWPYVSEMWI